MDGCMYACMYRCMYLCMSRWMDVYLDGWMIVLQLGFLYQKDLRHGRVKLIFEKLVNAFVIAQF